MFFSQLALELKIIHPPLFPIEGEPLVLKNVLDMGSPHGSPVLFGLLAATASLAFASQPLTCAELTVQAGGELQCSTFGGKSHVIELLGAGSSHACQEMDVDSRVPYEVSGEVYPRSTCGSDVPCPPSVVVCPGDYAGGLRHPFCRRRGSRLSISLSCAYFLPAVAGQTYGLVHVAGAVCDLSRGYVGGIPSASLAGAWTPFNTTFVPFVDVVTVCIMQHGTGSTVVSNLIVRQLVGTPRTSLHALPPACPRMSPLPPRRCAWAVGSRARYKCYASCLAWHAFRLRGEWRQTLFAGGASAPASAHPPYAGAPTHVHALVGADAQGFASRAMLQGTCPALPTKIL